MEQLLNWIHENLLILILSVLFLSVLGVFLFVDYMNRMMEMENDEWPATTISEDIYQQVIDEDPNVGKDE